MEIDGGTSTYGFLYPSRTDSEIIIGNKATFLYEGKHFRTGGDVHQIRKFTCKEGSTAVLSITGPLSSPDNNGIINLDNGNGATSVERGASLYVMLETSATSIEEMPIWLDRSSLTLDAPKRVVFYNGGKSPALAAYGSETNTKLKLGGIRSLKLYTTASTGTIAGAAGAFKFDNPITVDDAGNVTVNYTTIDNPTTFWELQGTERDENGNCPSSAFKIEGGLDGNANRNDTNTTYTVSSEVTGYDTAAVVPGAKTTLEEITFNDGNKALTKIIDIVGSYSAPPTVNKLMAGMTTISGTGIAGSEIAVKILTGDNVTDFYITDVGDDGKWSVPSRLLVEGEIVCAYQREMLGTEYQDESIEAKTTVLSKGLVLTGENQTKRYDDDTRLYANIETNDFDFENIEIRYIRYNNPDAIGDDFEAYPQDPEIFNAVYNDVSGAVAASGELAVLAGVGGYDYSAKMDAVSSNCAIWVQAKVQIGTETLYMYDTISYRNIFKLVDIRERGMIDDPDDALTDLEKVLYPYTLIDGQYGVPYNEDETVTDLSKGNTSIEYDTVELNIRDAYSTYWTATTLMGDPLPYKFTLNDEFLKQDDPESDSEYYYTLMYSHKESMWIYAPVNYVDVDGVAVSVNGETSGTISVPLTAKDTLPSVNFFDNNGRYSPPTDPSKDDTKPVGWVVATEFKPGSNYTENTEFASAKFKPIFTDISNEKLYIVYKTGQFEVQEIFLDENNKVVSPMVPHFKAKQNTQEHTSKPAVATGYVPVSYVTEGMTGTYDYTFSLKPGDDPTASQYALFPELTIPGDQLTPDGNNTTVTITYKYAVDSNNNGIPDSEEAFVKLKWHGYMAGNPVSTSIQDEVTIDTRKGVDLTVHNDYPKTTGSKTHTIGSVWIFDQYMNDNDAIRIVKPDDEQKDITETFVYGYATDGKTLDNRQFVIENYNLLEATDANETSKGTEFDQSVIVSGEKKYILKSNPYTATPKNIDDYVYIGYRIENEAGDALDSHGNPIASGAAINNITYENGKSPKDIQVKITSQPERYKVIHLYREKAATITINWEGTTHAGNHQTLYSQTKYGYVGEVITVKYTDYAGLAEYWKLTELSAKEHTLTFSANTQKKEFTFKESTDQVKITTVYKSEDNSINFTSVTEHIVTDSPYDINAMTMDGYKLLSWTLVDQHGDEIDSGDDTDVPVTVDPSKGSQTLTFNYKSTRTVVYVRTYDDEGIEIPGVQKFDNVTIGETFAAVAPAIEGYELLNYDELIKTIVVEEGTNNIRFDYREITGGTLILREDDEQGRIIEYRDLGLVVGEVVEIPNLEESYYTALTKDEEIYTTVGQTITYLYTKDTMKVVIRPIDVATGNIVEGQEDKTLEVLARIGEMTTVSTDLVVPQYTLSDTVSKTVYADPLAEENTLVVGFNYEKDVVGAIVVSYVCGTETLQSYQATAVVGSKFTANYVDFPGYELESDSTIEIIVEKTEGEEKNEIIFNYKDIRKVVTIESYDAAGVKLDGVDDVIDRVPKGDPHTITVGAVDGYVLEAYQIEEGSKVEVALGTSTIKIVEVEDDMTVKLYYGLIEDVVGKNTVTITVIGKDAAGKQLYTYDVVKAKSATAEVSITAFVLGGYELTSDNSPIDVALSANSTVTFEYASLAATVIIKAVLTDDSAVPDFTDITVPATEGGVFTYRAPYIPGYNLVGAVSQMIDPVAAGVNELTFKYEKAVGNVIILLKENDENGRVIKTMSKDGNEGESLTIDIPGLTEDHYTAIGPDSHTIEYGSEKQTIEFYYSKDTTTVTVYAKDTNGNDIGAEAKAFENQRIGEPFTAYSSAITGYTLVGSTTQTVVVEKDQIVTFIYLAEGEGSVVVNAVKEGTDTVLYTYTLTGRPGEKLTVNAPTVVGWQLVDKTKNTAEAILGGSAVNFEYKTDTFDVTVNLKDASGNKIEDSIVYAVDNGTEFTAYAPHIPGYVVDGYSSKYYESVTVAEEVTFTYKSIAEVVDDYTVTITVIGVDAAGNELYTYKVVKVKSATATETINAFELGGYELASTEQESKIVKLDGSVDRVEFKYASLATTVTIKAVLEATTESVPNFTDIYAPATEGQAFSYNAPYIPGYNLVGAATQTIDAVADDAELTFEYKAATGNVVIILKEDNEDGRVIKTMSEDVTEGDEKTIIAPDLEAEYYTSISEAQTVKYSSEKQTIEFYYTKDTTDVTVKAVDEADNSAIGTDVTYTGVRVGEVSSFNAPAVNGYKLVGNPTQTVVVETDQIVTFEYATLEEDEVLVNAVTTLGEETVILHSYVLKGVKGSDITVNAPELAGWTLADNEAASAKATVPSTVTFNYVKDTFTVTIKLEDKDGNEIAAPAGVVTEYEVANATEFTAYAPHVPGYVLVGNQSEYFKSVDTVKTAKFTYKPISDVVDEYTLDIKIVGETTMGKPIYNSTKTVPHNSGVYAINEGIYSGNYALDKVLVDGAEVETETPVNVTAIENDIEVTFIYRELKAQVTIHVLDADTGEHLMEEIQEDAIESQPFTYNAPAFDIDGTYYCLVEQISDETNKDAFTGRIDNVAGDGSSKIKFFYKPATGDAVLVIKEDDADGRIIAYSDLDPQEMEVGTVYDVEIKNYKDQYYTFVGCGDGLTVKEDDDTLASFTYNDSGATMVLEMYYSKDMGTVEVIALDENGEKITSENVPGRMGEAIVVNALKVPGYDLNGNSIQMVVVEEGAEATFNYTPQSEDGSLTITIKDSSKNLVSGAVVTVTDSGGGTTTLTTDASGIVKLEDMAFGTYDIEVTHSSFDDASASLSISAGNPDAETTIVLGKTISSGGGGGGASTYTVTYKSNGASGDDFKVTGVGKGSSYLILDLAGTDISNSKESLAAWNTEKDGTGTSYAPGQKINVVKNLTLYAQWGDSHILYIHGFEDGEVKVDNNMSRAEFAMIIYRLLGSPTVSKTDYFSDVDENAWYADAINYLASTNRISGYPDGTFKPSNNVTRAEFITLIVGYEHTPLVSTAHPFDDVAGNHWATDSIATGYDKGWILGYPDGTFRSEQPVTRAEAITLINGMLNRSVDEKTLAKVECPFDDLSTKHWAYAEVIEAIIDHTAIYDEANKELWINH